MTNGVIETLEERGIKPTSIRILVLKAMFEFDRAFSLGDMESLLVSVDKSTISRTIHLFHNNQLIHSFDDGSGSIKYSIRSSGNDYADEEVLHAHFYCKYCKKAYCLENVHVPQFELPNQLEIEDVNLVIKGYCGKCKKFAT